MTTKANIKKISKAIRANGVKHIKGLYFDFDKDHNIIAACAVGQAAYNLDKDKPENGLNIFWELVGPLRDDTDYFACPEFDKDNCQWGKAKTNVGNLIIHLNDNHEYALDQISDWLDGLAA